MSRTLAAVLLGALLVGGCAKRGPGVAGGAGEPLAIVSEKVEKLPGGQASVKLVVRGDPGQRAVETFLRRYVDERRRRGEELWVALFLEGMDQQSIEYAFAIARPGESPRITVRESVQTYR